MLILSPAPQPVMFAQFPHGCGIVRPQCYGILQQGAFNQSDCDIKKAREVMSLQTRLADKTLSYSPDWLARFK